MPKTVFKQATIVSCGNQRVADLMVEDGKIVQIDSHIASGENVAEVNCEGKYLLPGMIDTHVHFREPGATQKGDISTESKAAVAGGVTTICDMPNTNPQTVTIEAARQKLALYAAKSLCNYGVYIGATRDNLEELKRAEEEPGICAIKIFMAESTGEMTLSDPALLEKIFANTSKLIATHAEDEALRISRKEAFARGELTQEGIEMFGEEIGPHDLRQHALIRNNQVAYQGTQLAVELAIRTNHRTHILHMSSAQELPFLTTGKKIAHSSGNPLVTGETCPHYLYFNRNQIEDKKGFLIMNPALKGPADSLALWQALQDGIIDHITTDHAPHLAQEKEQPYGQLPAGLPAVQFVYQLMLHHALNTSIPAEKKLSIEQVVAYCCENPAKHYNIKNKGILQAGYDADIVIVDSKQSRVITRQEVLSRCSWTPYENFEVTCGVIQQTYVNGELVFSMPSQIALNQSSKAIVTG